MSYMDEQDMIDEAITQIQLAANELCVEWANYETFDSAVLRRIEDGIKDLKAILRGTK